MADNHFSCPHCGKSIFIQSSFYGTNVSRKPINIKANIERADYYARKHKVMEHRPLWNGRFGWAQNQVTGEWIYCHSLEEYEREIVFD